MEAKEGSPLLEVQVESMSSSLASSVVINTDAAVVPIIIEELDENALDSMDVDMDEFVEAKALQVGDMTDDIITGYADHEENDVDVGVNMGLDVDADTTLDNDEQDAPLTAEEEDRLTKLFLNGELTFCEYSSRMDQNADLETVDGDSFRRETENEESDVPKITRHKGQKCGGTVQGRQRRKRRTLPAVLQGLMGEANLRFARGETELAAQICMEIIRQVPSAPEPFHTLAMIYEQDQPEKSLQFALIAAHLSPKDADQWVRLANLSLEKNNIRQAITCYSKAIQASPTDVTLYDTRAQLLEQNGDKKAYLKGYTKLVNQLEPEDGECIIKYAKMLAKRYMQESNHEQALEAMEHIFSKCPNLITLEEVNIMTELLIALRQFKRCLDILRKYTNIMVKYKGEGKEEAAEIERCEMPDSVVIDLKAKFLIAVIGLDRVDIAEGLLPGFYLNENPETDGDLFLDVAEALMGKKEFKRALDLLDPLVASKNFSLAAVWLRHAECWVGCKDLKKAIASYEVVRELSPQHLGARLALAKIYKLQGQYEKAIRALEQDPDSDVLHPDAVYQRTLLLFKVQRYEEYFRSGNLLLARHCVTIRSKVELNTLARVTGVRQRLDTLQLHRLSCGEKLEEENAPTFVNDPEPSERNEFLLFLQMCRLACKLKRYGLLQRMCFGALTSKRFEKRNSHIMFLCLISCIHNNDSYYGYNLVRELVRVRQKSNSWNLLNIIIQRAEDSRHNRFIMRLLGREDVFSYLHIMHANNCLVSGTYKYALHDYVSLFRVAPGALLALLIAVTLMQMAYQKLSAKKNQLVIQALAFLDKYAQLRGKEARQETYYNTARAFHQIGLLPTAVRYYNLVLTVDPGELVSKNANLLDLRREAAYNLHLIYMQSENYSLARMYLENYITISEACASIRLEAATESSSSTLSLALALALAHSQARSQARPSARMSARPTLASRVRFDKMCAALEGIARARPADKLGRLANFLASCRELGRRSKADHSETDASLYPVLRLLLPQLERERGPLNLREKTLGNLYIRLLCLGKGSAEGNSLLRYKAPASTAKLCGKDFAERAYRVARNRLPQAGTGLTVEEIHRYLDEILRSRDEAFESLVRRMSPLEFKWFTRIILKDLKLGIGSARILQAYHPDAKELLEVTSDLREITDHLQDPGRRYRSDLRIFCHFKPMLLERCRIEEVDRLFANGEEYFMQTKYDGERSQMHMKAGKYRYFTRRGYDITSKPGYGESVGSGGLLSEAFARLLNPECESIILDGELMGWHKEKKTFGSKGMNFDVKNLSASSCHRPCFVAFDVVMYNEQVLLDLPYAERLRILASVVAEEAGTVMLDKSILVSNSEEVLRAFNESIERKEEGIVMKRSDVTYKPNARNGNGCYKIKAEYSENLVQDVDLLILGCHYGDGKCAGSIGSFLMGVAVATEAAEPSEFLSLVSVSSGLTRRALEDLRARLEGHWRKSCPANVSPPKAAGQVDLWIRPEDSIVLTLRASEMVRSAGYPTGYSLRFPRVTAVRFDKPWYSVCTTTELRSLIKDDGFVQKLTRREATEYDVSEVPLAPMEAAARRAPLGKRRAAGVPPGKSIGKRLLEPDRPLSRLTRLLDDKEICVINGDEELSKESIEEILARHGARIVQNPRKETFCVIVGNVRSMKAQNVVRSENYDVVTTEWLKCATRDENWSSLMDFRPWDLLSCRESTKIRLTKNYDEFGDRYGADADEESLRASLSRVGQEVADLTAEQEKELDEELFPDGCSPYSVFRTMVGHFPQAGCDGELGKLEFRFMAGTLAEGLETRATHTFFRRKSRSAALRQPINEEENCSAKVLSEAWIERSFLAGRLSATDEYLLS